MRFALAVLATFALLAPPAQALASAAALDNSASVSLAEQQPTGEIDVNVNTDGGGAWWTNPVWIGIGVLALVVLVLIIALAARGGGTTVIKD
jgi:hypothetical protein